LKKLLFAISLCSALLTAHAQLPCDSVATAFQQWNTRMDKLNFDNPELISLHYLFLQDIRKEMTLFQDDLDERLLHCPQTDYYATKSAFNHLIYRAEKCERRLQHQKSIVDILFCQRAEEDLSYHDTLNAMYYLDRALQFNPSCTQALLKKSGLVFAQGDYMTCVELIHRLYLINDLTDEEERAVSDFTLQLYDKLYNLGDSLAKSGQSADALEVFLALEQFCSNMPSGYCNDDYYRGILRSREGVYESYLTIAREAEKRNNMEMAKKFYRYAEEYRKK